MASNKTSNQTCENQDDNQWPKFLMEAADQKVPLNLNAFVLKKAIDGMANAELDNVKPVKSGSVFIEVETKQQCKNLLKTTKLLGYLPVKVSPHRTLNSSKFVIKCEELDKMDEEEIKKELQPQGIIAVKRISIWYSLYVLTIKGQTIPKRINIGNLKNETRPYIPNPQRCFPWCAQARLSSPVSKSPFGLLPTGWPAEVSQPAAPLSRSPTQVCHGSVLLATGTTFRRSCAAACAAAWTCGNCWVKMKLMLMAQGNSIYFKLILS